MIKVVAGIVTYNPDIERLTENIRAIIEQIENIVIVDNGSENLEEIKSCCEKNCNSECIHILALGENKGIAYALNRIVEQSMEIGGEWTLTLDQDSVIPGNMMDEYMKYLNSEQYHSKVAMLVPKIWDRVMQTDISDQKDVEDDYVQVETAITSGTLMENSIWKQLGGFTEELFIDYVDFDYCMKVKLSNYSIIKVNSVKLLHELGNATEVKLFEFLVKFTRKNTSLNKLFTMFRYTSNHSAERLYYVTRNQYWYMDKYKAYIDVKKMKKSMRIEWIIKLLSEKEKVKKYKSIKEGIRDGKELKLGPRR